MDWMRERRTLSRLGSRADAEAASPDSLVPHCIKHTCIKHPIDSPVLHCI